MESILNISSEEREKLKVIDSLAKELGKILPPPDPLLKQVVIIPAKNESHHIEGTLISLSRQTAPDNSAICYRSFEVLILCHNCLDNTFEVVENFL